MFHLIRGWFCLTHVQPADIIIFYQKRVHPSSGRDKKSSIFSVAFHHVFPRGIVKWLGIPKNMAWIDRRWSIKFREIWKWSRLWCVPYFQNLTTCTYQNENNTNVLKQAQMVSDWCILIRTCSSWCSWALKTRQLSWKYKPTPIKIISSNRLHSATLSATGVNIKVWNDRKSKFENQL